MRRLFTVAEPKVLINSRRPSSREEPEAWRKNTSLKGLILNGASCGGKSAIYLPHRLRTSSEITGDVIVENTPVKMGWGWEQPQRF